MNETEVHAYYILSKGQRRKINRKDKITGTLQSYMGNKEQGKERSRIERVHNILFLF
jgi:hypothetical protein